MKRHLMTLALGALVGSFVMVNSAQACHKRKAVCAQPTAACAPAPAPVVYVPAPAPVCEPAPVCAPAPKKHGFGFGNPLKGMKLGHGHKKAAPVCAPAPVVYEQTVYAAPQAVYAAPQASPQASPQVPTKATPQAPAKASPQG